MKAPASIGYIVAVALALLCNIAVLFTTDSLTVRVVEAAGAVAWIVLLVAAIRSRRRGASAGS